ncbi:hypothetical protein [Streptomyces sp. NRRL F-5650]|uniref:hypothetical protein n=1 Tax=Streptomyces sp. NRRL F-5650 TaxID=1463868 RepID=UPI0004C53311|nr:hypothetical protein [Streptomyces sp. NRRL F-5650]
MAEESYPNAGHNNRQVTDDEHELLASRFSDDGIYGDPTDTQVVTAGTGLSVNVRADVAASVRGHGWYSGSTPFSVPLAANISSQTRIDWIVLRLDRSDWRVRVAVVGGTPGSGAPALKQQTGNTGVYEIPLAQARILGGASSVTVTRAELYVGTRIRPCTSATRNPAPRLGEMAFETDTKRLVLWDGKTWRLVSQDSGEVVLQKLNNVSWVNAGDSVLEQRGGAVWLRIGGWTRNGSTLAAASESQLPVLIPEAYLPHTRYQYWNVYVTHATTASMARLTIYPRGNKRGGQLWLTQHVDIRHLDDLKATTMTWTVN